MPQYELNLNDYLRIVHKRRSVIIFVFLAVTLVTFVYVSRITPVYEATATVKVEERKTVAGLLTEWIVFTPANIMESQTKLIEGFPVMERAVKDLGLVNEGSTPEDIQIAVTMLQGQIMTSNVGNTNIIEIQAVSSVPAESMVLANTVARAAIEENLMEKNKQARTVRKFIEEQLSALETRLRETEDRLRDFGDEVKDIGLSAPIQERLVELEFELVALLQKYTEKHPRVQQVRNQIGDLESQLEGFSGQELEYARLAREVEVSRKLYSMLKEKLEEARITEAQKIGDISLVNPAVLPTSPMGPNKVSTILLGAIMGLILGTALAFIRENIDTSIGTIEDIEAITGLKVLGVIPPVKHGSDEGENFFKKITRDIMFLGRPKEDDTYSRLVSYYEPGSLVAESYRSVRTNLKLGPSLKTLLVTSAGPREGKTAVVTNLGMVIAQTGVKTVLVSSDLRRPMIAKTFGVKRDLGFNEVITGQVKLDGALLSMTDIMMGDMKLEKMMEAPPGIENIWILPSGHIPPNPAEFLESKETDKLILELRNRFDIVLFDSPPVLPVTDAALLASKVDGVILVYEAGRTARGALLRTKAQLESVGANILGVILNHIQPGPEASLSYPYYYEYKMRYGKSREEAENGPQDKKIPGQNRM